MDSLIEIGFCISLHNGICDWVVVVDRLQLFSRVHQVAARLVSGTSIFYMCHTETVGQCVCV